MYKEENGALRIYKKNIINEPPNLLKIVQNSYSKYLLETCYEDIEYLSEKLTTILHKPVIVKECIVGKAEGDDLVTELTIRRSKYYPVNVIFEVNGIELPKVTVLKIPYMNEKGVFNVDGKERIIYNELVQSEDLIIENNLIMLRTKDYTFNFVKSRGSLVLKAPYKSKISLASLAVYIACRYGNLITVQAEDNQNTGYKYLNNIYCNKIMKLSASKIRNEYTSTTYEVVDKSLHNIDFTKLRLGRGREILDNYFSFEKLLGRVLAKPIWGFKAGEIITEHTITQLYLKHTVAVYIKYCPDLTGMYLCENIKINCLPKGLKISKFIENTVLQLQGQGYVKEDMNVNINLYNGIIIDEDINEFLYDLDIDSVKVSTSKTGEPLDIPFYTEVRNNATIKAELFYKDKSLPVDIAKQQYVDWYTGKPKGNLDYYDLTALISFICGALEIPEIFRTYRRDVDFIKTVNTVSESLSSVYRYAINWVIGTRNLQIREAIKYPSKFQQELNLININALKYLQERTLLRPAEYRNPVTLVTQVRRIATIVSMKEAAADAMRNTLMGHYGRICPFDTPQSANIGLMNSIAVRATVDDGILKTPYHKIININGKYYIDRNVIYLSPKEEFTCKIGDILSIEHETNNIDIFQSPIKNTLIKARVPSIDFKDDERLTVESVPSHELDYVNVYEDQILSVGTCLVPFVGADEGARVSFGTSMLRQADPILQSKSPYVVTDMYSWLVEDSAYIIRAKEDGVIKEISNIGVTVLYDSGRLETFQVDKSMIRSDGVILMETHVLVGEHVKKNQILMDSITSKDGYFSPGTDLLCAYISYYGYNNEDGIVMTSAAAEKFKSITINKVTRTFDKANENQYYYKEITPIGKYVGENDIICKIYSRKQNKNLGTAKLAASYGKTGILYSITKEINEQENSATFVAVLINFADLDTGDKMTGRHGNKGVVTKVIKNSEAPSFKNGVLTDIILNPNGVGSHMNLGQLLEAHLGFVCYLLDLHIISNSFNGATKEEIMELLQYCYDLSNADCAEDVIQDYLHLPEIVHQHARDRFNFIKTWQDCFYPDGTATLINNKNGKPFENRIIIGCSYWLKLGHEVEHKRNERKGFENDVPYSAITKQPTKGASKKGGQTVGEMEFWAFIAHGASQLIRESLNDTSDNVYRREAYLNDYFTGIKSEGFDYDAYSNRSIELIRFYLEVCGIDITTNFGSLIDLEHILNKINHSETDVEDNIIDNLYNTLSDIEGD